MNDLEGVSIQMKDQKKKPSDDNPDQVKGKGKNADNKIPSANEIKEEMKDIQGNLKKGIPQNVGASIVSLGDKDMAAWKLISDVPYVPTPWSYLCLIINLILPGFGTMLSSIWGDPCSKTQFCVGLLQFFLTYLLVGWIISVIWGILIVKRSWGDPTVNDALLATEGIRSDAVNAATKQALRR